MFAKYRLPAHADFLQHANRGAVVDIDGRDDAFGAQIEKCRIDERESDLGRESLAPVRVPSMYPKSTTLRSINDKSHAPDHAPGSDFLDRQFESRARPLRFCEASRPSR